jgi:fluoroacetyl-CoA thioesterase
MSAMLETGVKGRMEEAVVFEKTAANICSGTEEVYATPCMIALMEGAANKSVAPFLEEGCSTVGTMLNVRHLSATPIGMKVWAETELTEVDHKRLVFFVKAFDEKGLIGEGTHERFIIYKEKFLKKAYDKKNA